jgi:hypothetical protein
MAVRLTRRAGRELSELIAQLAAAEARTAVQADGTWDRLVAEVAARRVDPYAAADMVLRLAAHRGSSKGS